MITDEKIHELASRFEETEARLSAPSSSQDYAALSKDYAARREAGLLARALLEAREERQGLEAMRNDPEMRALAVEEGAALDAKIARLEASLEEALLPEASGETSAKGDARIILEIRAAAGGEEAALFAADLFRMYQRYAALKGWQCETLSFSASETGGAREIIAALKGEGAFDRLQYESGVHRVQRIPSTESGGRIHTSTATVAVLAEPGETQIVIEAKDLRIDVFRARGPGGQSVNTTDSAVRIAHLPSGIVVTQQDEKSQHRNKARAMTILRARLFEKEQEAQRSAQAETRRGQIGRGDRSERIRTYNFPQARITDHRLGRSFHALHRILDGSALEELLESLALKAEEEA